MTRRSTNRDRSARATHGPRRAGIAIAVIAHLQVFAGGAAAQAPTRDEAQPPSAERRQAELRYQEHSLRFAAMYRVTIEQGIHSVQRQWLVLRGDPGEVVPPREFYRAIGRDDLARAVGRRRALMIGGYIVGALGFAVTIVQTVILFNGDACGFERPPGHSTCYDLTSYPLVPWLSTLGIGVAGLVVGTHYLRHPEPIEDDEARALADEYNARLRRGLGLTRATPRPVLRDVTLTPYVLGHEGGLAVRTQF